MFSVQPKSDDLQPWLNDPRWTFATMHAKEDTYRLVLNTLPGVIGGAFSASVKGIQRDLYGRAQITINGYVVQSNRDHEGDSPATLVDDFLEITFIDIKTSRIDLEFLIPFEATSVDDGAHWTLLIEFKNGTSEFFEIPVFRTYDSDPTLDSVKIAALNSAKIDETARPPHLPKLPSYELSITDKFRLQLPSSVTGQPSLFSGLAIVTGLWATVSVAFNLLFSSEGSPWVLFFPLPIMGLLLLFLKKGVTTMEIDKNLMSVHYSLFGVSIPSTLKRENVVGFSMKCLGILPSANGTQAAYLLGVRQNEGGFKILTPALLNQWDSRLLVKRLNEFWEIDL